LIAAERSDEFL
jgi:hypothetical protein